MKKLMIIAGLMALCLGAAAQEKIYSVKSGKVTMEMDMMGQKIVQQNYFDDYGVKQATVMEMMGQKMRSIEVDGKNVMIDDAAKTAISMPGMGPQMGGNNKINFLNLDEKTIKKNKIKEEGQEEVAGKMCTKYSYRMLMMGQGVTVHAWVYKGITLKTAIKTDFGEMVTKATKVEEDIQVDPALFVLPEGVEVQEMDMSMMGGGF
jgi:catabolite regulation protein CreA